LAKDPAQKERLGNIMAHLVESLRTTAIILQPFLTDAPQEVFKQLGITDDELKTWDSAYEQGVVSAGTMVQKGEPIFPRLDMEDEVKGIQEMMKQTQKEYKQDSEQQEDEKQIVNFDDFIPSGFVSSSLECLSLHLPYRAVERLAHLFEPSSPLIQHLVHMRYPTSSTRHL